MLIKFRRVGKEDIPEIQSLASLVWKEAYSAILSDDQINYMLELMCSAKVIARELLDGVEWDIIVDGNKPCGFLSYAFGKDNSVKLSKIYIKKEARGKSIAAESISRVLRYAEDNGKKSVFLTVNKNNKRAIRAYEKNGFTITDSVITDIGNGFVMDDYIMECPVKLQQPRSEPES
jgi:diamine N-acetyltransferase